VTRRNGLLAFICTLLAAVAALLHLPMVARIGDIAGLLAGAKASGRTPLAIALTPPTASQIPAGPGGAQPLTLFNLQRENLADPDIIRLSTQYGVEAHVLKAHLAQACEGVLGDQGHFWARLPEGDGEVEDSGLARTQAAAALLDRYSKQTGSVHGALIAWRAGAPRAARALSAPPGPEAPDLEQALAALRRRMIAPYRHDARQWLCSVHGLAAALQARWPVPNRDVSLKEGQGVRLAASPGQTIMASMPGRVGFVGIDGPRGLCVEVIHACDLRSEVCWLKAARVAPGELVEVGMPLGTAGRLRPRFNLWLGVIPIEVTQLLGPDEPAPKEPPAPTIQPAEEQEP
jgi:hypothetical protein